MGRKDGAGKLLPLLRLCNRGGGEGRACPVRVILPSLSFPPNLLGTRVFSALLLSSQGFHIHERLIETSMASQELPTAFS